MSVLDILTYPDQRLKRIAEPVQHFDQALQDFARELELTMDNGPGAVGIAAPQVGVSQRIIIVDVSGRKKTTNHGRQFLVNPEITHWEGLEKGREGCLSVPEYTGNVVRACQIQLRAQNLDGETLNFEMEGFEARAIQHELDHLNGLLFLDRLVSRHNDLFTRKKNQKKG